MDKKPAFEKFAPAILKTYQRDKEAFWAAVMAPFLANNISLSNDHLLTRLVDVTELRLDNYFRKGLKISRY